MFVKSNLQKVFRRFSDGLVISCKKEVVPEYVKDKDIWEQVDLIPHKEPIKKTVSVSLVENKSNGTFFVIRSDKIPDLLLDYIEVVSDPVDVEFTLNESPSCCNCSGNKPNSP